MDEPVHVGCLVRVQLVGVLEAQQTERNGERVRNDRLLAVAVDSYQHQPLDKLERPLLDEISHFFASYNELRGKQFKVKAFRGPKRAARLLAAGMKAFTERAHAASVKHATMSAGTT
jgi:inorganic pyrophosphatase